MSEPAKKLRVLIVDDNPPVLSAMRRTLGGHDYEIAIVLSFEDAIALLEVQEFDAIVTDTDLGTGPGGPELLGVVRVRWPDMGRVIMSGADQGEALDALKSGAAHVFFAKPWVPSGPKEAITAALERVAAARRSV